MDIKSYSFYPIDARMYVIVENGKALIIDPSISEDAKKYLKNPKRVIVTGTPLRASLLETDAFAARRQLGSQLVQRRVYKDKTFVLRTLCKSVAKTIQKFICLL